MHAAPSVCFADVSPYYGELPSRREPSINQAFTYKSIKNLLSEARLRLPSPVGEGAELAEADEVSAVPTAKLGHSGIKIVTVYPDGVI